MNFPNEKLTRNLWGQRTPSPSVAVRYGGAFQQLFSAGWKKYLVRELSKVPGGMNGLTMTEHGYTNKPETVERGANA